MKILMHSCCGPCSLYPLKVLAEEGYRATLYYSNPNIHPYKEWKERKKSLVTVAEGHQIPYEIDKEYPLEDYLRRSLAAGDRCLFCYRTRLEKTAVRGLELNMEAFSTTLLVSPYQKHEEIRAIGEEIADSTGLPFYYRDFREGFSSAQEQAKQLELYRQKYCGCVFSERDRYLKKK